jgi:hypothetical protein
MNTIPPGFTFPPIEGKFTPSNAMVFANKLLFERTGRLCLARNFEEPAGLHIELLAANDLRTEGLLEDGRSYIGTLQGVFSAYGLDSVGMELPDIAYGLGRVPADKALPQLPEGSWWLPEFVPFALKDGRSGWTWTGGYFASPPNCGQQ